MMCNSRGHTIVDSRSTPLKVSRDILDGGEGFQSALSATDIVAVAIPR